MFKTPKDLANIRMLLRVAQRAHPVLGWLGINFDRSKIDDLVNTMDNLLDFATFNDTFADRGWIAHDCVSVKEAVAALEAAKAGDWARADDLLVAAHSPGMVRMWVGHFRALRCFEKRVPLALLAADDYEAGRYHACVPVVLALLDGMGQELTGAGFLRQGVRFTKVDSFIEIGPGLGRLIRAMTPSRGRTTTDAISMPFRHGILHGVDLGYGTQLVAAKAWGALLAMGSYARGVEKPPAPEPPKKGLLQTLKEYAEHSAHHDELMRHLDAWAPRSADEIHASIRGAEPSPGTPEATVVQLLRAWQGRKFGIMARVCVEAEKVGINPFAGRIRSNLGPAPQTFALQEVEDRGAGLSWVTVRLRWSADEGEDGEDTRLQLSYLINGEVGPRNMPGGRWFVGSLWPLEVFRLGTPSGPGEDTNDDAD